jgi:Uma2 family endonuclease
MSAHSETFVTEDEYLRRELEAEYKSEYFNGEIFAMGGATEAHVSIVTNLIAALKPQFKIARAEFMRMICGCAFRRQVFTRTRM